MNEQLTEVSRLLFGDKAELRVVDPKELVLLQENARYFKKEIFQQLTRNLKDDGFLSSVPLCMPLEGGRLEVRSGNHRVESAVQAGIAHVLVIVDLRQLTEGEKIAVQLSHNALVGEDDPVVLASLWAKIEDIAHRLYAGLSSDLVKELEAIKIPTFGTPAVRTKSLSFLFTEPEIGKLDDILEQARALLALDVCYVAPMESFDTFFQALRQVKQAKKIKNASLALVKMAELVREALDRADIVEAPDKNYAMEGSDKNHANGGEKPRPPESSR